MLRPVVHFTLSTNFFMALGYLEQTKASRLPATGSPYHSMGCVGYKRGRYVYVAGQGIRYPAIDFGVTSVR